MLRSIGIQSGESVESVRKKKRKAMVGRKSEGVMDDESGELAELVEKVPLKELTDAKVERLVRG